MIHFWSEQYPFQMKAQCNQLQAQTLFNFDHHRVVVQGCWGILLTYPWMTLAKLPDAPVLTVVFHPAPERVTASAWVRQIVQAHPAAPSNIQVLVDQLSFRGE